MGGRWEGRGRGVRRVDRPLGAVAVAPVGDGDGDPAVVRHAGQRHRARGHDGPVGLGRVVDHAATAVVVVV